MHPTLGLLFMAACAIFYYRVGEQEYSSGIAIAAVSVALWLGGEFLLGFGLLGSILVQVGLFAALTAWNLLRDEKKKRGAPPSGR